MRKEDLRIPMRDGVSLVTSLYLPDDDGAYPALLMRHPYGQLYPDQMYEAMTQDGYAVLFQNERGRFGSEGEWLPLDSQSIRDGEDSVSWIAAQSWCNGKVGMFGSSYGGITQWHAALANPESLLAIAPVGSGTIQDYFPFASPGVWALGTLLGWTLNVAYYEAEKLDVKSDVPEIQAMLDLSRKLMESTQIGSEDSFKEMVELAAELPTTFENLLEKRPLSDFSDAVERFAPWVQEWLSHPDPSDPYWHDIDWSKQYDKIEVPVLMTAGWYDLFVTSAFRDYSALQKKAEGRLKLIVHPGSHTAGVAPPGYQRVGDRLFPMPELMDDWGLNGNSTGTQPNAIKAWFDHWLKGSSVDYESPPIELYVMGENVWRFEHEWPLARTQWTNFYLRSSGHANTLSGDGELSQELPDAEAFDRYEYDPMNPVPTSGGRGLNPVLAGVHDNTEVEKRPDVLVYTTPSLKNDTEITGPVVLKLWASTSAVDTDFTAKLLDVTSEGVAYNLTEGITRLQFREHNPGLVTPGEVQEVTIELAPTSNVFKAGHRIRLEVSSSNFPFADPNPNTGRTLFTDTETIVAEQKVFHGDKSPSHLILPVISGE